MEKQANIDALNAIAARASKFTGRALMWSFNQGIFTLGDKTTYGNLALALNPLREVYMRISHFGLSAADIETIKTELS